jgi:Mn2+/Fe2+ NRAMP family transporter
MNKGKKQQWIEGSFVGAAFLMATSAIGPGFITQTTVFTAKLGASFGFVILASILIDIIVQLNIWRTLAASGLKAPALVNKVVPGSGILLSVLVVLGGLVFNTGNIAGCGLALKSIAGLDPVTGAVISSFVAIILFLVREFGKAMDAFAKWLGLLMIAIVVFVAIGTKPPLQEVVTRTFWPSEINLVAILTLVGGTVGGYISFAGAHRMLDASEGKVPEMKAVSQSAVSGILISGIMRVGLFIAAFGVVATGFSPDSSNPAASIFRQALGPMGEIIFGIILWCAAITSVVGASYTSISFLENWHPVVRQFRQWFIVAFIILGTIAFAGFGNPVGILVAAGAINGLILPVALGLILLTHVFRKLPFDYRHPLWLKISGWLAVALLAYISAQAIGKIL